MRSSFTGSSTDSFQQPLTAFFPISCARVFFSFVITSAAVEVKFYRAFVCLSVCLSVPLTVSKFTFLKLLITDRIFMKILLEMC